MFANCSLHPAAPSMPCAVPPWGGGYPNVLDCGIDAATWDDYSARIHALAAKVGADVSLVRHVVDMARLNRLEGWTNGSAPSPDESPRTFLIMLVMPWANIAVCRCSPGLSAASPRASTRR